MDLTITPDDFHARAGTSRKPLPTPAPTYSSFLPNNEVVSRGNADRDELIGCMSEEFTRASYLQKAEEMGIKFETATSWLKRLCKNGLVEKTDDKGVYRKPQA